MNNNRLAVYTFWEKNGIVRPFVLYYLTGLQEVAKTIYVVVNGEISNEGRNSLTSIGCHVIQRENIGVDFWAYKTAIEKEGDLSKYDEVILCNCSCYGPVYSFTEMFEDMGKKELDFWGITEWPYDAMGYKGTWILSYFMVFRRNLFLSKEWAKYWENLVPVNNRDEAINLHEVKFTKYFSDKGFTYDVYCHNSGKYIDPTIEAPFELVTKNRCPLIKRKAFCADYDRFLSFHRGNSSKKLLAFLNKSKIYDINMIFDDMLATQHYYHFKNAINLNYVLPANVVVAKLDKPVKVAVCMHLYYEDLLEKNISYLESLPDFVDIYITTPKKKLVSEIENELHKRAIKVKTIELINPRGRAESAFLVATKHFIKDYDFACIVHDKKSSFLQPGCKGEEFGFHNLDSLLLTKAYVLNILKTFENNPRLGILAPFNVNFAEFRGLPGREWGANFNGTKNLLQKAFINVPIAEDVPPVAPMGAMFWFRPKCLEKLVNIDWDYDDFPPEPLPLDGSLIHCIERAYPFFAQEAGFLTGWLISDYDSETYLNNISYLYRQAHIGLINKSVSRNIPKSKKIKNFLKRYANKIFLKRNK